MATIVGTADDDYRVGTQGNDTITGLAGDDTLIGRAGNDVIFGGTGSDTLIGGAGKDTLIDNQDSGNPLATSLLVGGSGDDVIRANIHETLSNIKDVTVEISASGGCGDDRIDVHAEAFATYFAAHASNLVDGGAGDDVITAVAITTWSGRSVNIISGGSGDDVIDASASASGSADAAARNDISAGRGDDVVRSEASASIFADGYVAATTVIRGDAGDDVLEAATQGFIPAGGGAVVLRSEVYGGAGDDVLKSTLTGYVYDGGFDFRSSLFGGSGDDILQAIVTLSADASYYSVTGSTLLDGGTGRDQIAGSAAQDRIIGGSGADTMSGGAGDDTFVCRPDAGRGVDIVRDFGNGNDRIELTAFHLSAAGLQALLAQSSGETIDLGSIGGTDLRLIGVDVASLHAADFIL